MVPTINPRQSEQLRAFIERDARDRAAVDAPQPAYHLEWLACEVPGMVAVCDPNGWRACLLYPVERPVPRDPLFQHATALRALDLAPPLFILMHVSHMRALSYRDPAVHDSIDAPEVMPAGSCTGFAYDDDVYGAHQSIAHRED